jgi:pyruvate dehydrogenase (quinone)
MATHPAAIRHLVDRAFRTALAQRTVTCVILPRDLQEETAVPKPPRKHGTVHSGVGFTLPQVVPTSADLRRAAEVLNAGQRVAMLVGAGAEGATEEVLAVADVLGAGVAKALLGKTVVPDDLPFVTGSIGLLGTKPSWDLMEHCDTLFMVGTSFPYSEFLPEEGKARGVQIDLDGRMLSMRYPMEVPLIGDAQQTLRALLPLLRRKEDRAWRRDLEREVSEWWKTLEARAHAPAEPLNPQRVFWELSPLLPDGAVLTCDTGTATNWFARDLKLRPGMLAALSGGLATMGPGVPYAIAAKFAYPHRPVIAFVGDGAMQMNGINELITAAKYWREWKDPRLVILVLNNRDLSMVTWEQRAMSGDPKFPASQTLPDFPYASYAESLGFRGLQMNGPDEVARQWKAALASEVPVVVEARVDSNVPPLPPHITIEQAQAFVEALVKGDPERGGVIRQTFRAWFGRKQRGS